MTSRSKLEFHQFNVHALFSTIFIHCISILARKVPSPNVSFVSMSGFWAPFGLRICFPPISPIRVIWVFQLPISDLILSLSIRVRVCTQPHNASFPSSPLRRVSHANVPRLKITRWDRDGGDLSAAIVSRRRILMGRWGNPE